MWGEKHILQLVRVKAQCTYVVLHTSGQTPLGEETTLDHLLVSGQFVCYQIQATWYVSSTICLRMYQYSSLQGRAQRDPDLIPPPFLCTIQLLCCLLPPK